MTGESESINKALRSIDKAITKLFAEIAVSEERMENRVTKENLQIALREFEKGLEAKIAAAIKNDEQGRKEIYEWVDDKLTPINDSIVNLKVDTKGTATKVAIIVSIVMGIVSIAIGALLS